jgi:hypothetical protein
MACCIFAAMIIANALMYTRRIKRFFGFKVSDEWDDLYNDAPSNSQKQRYLWTRCVAASLLLGATATYGSLHWHHMVADLGLNGHKIGKVVPYDIPINAEFFDGAYDVSCGTDLTSI